MFPIVEKLGGFDAALKIVRDRTGQDITGFARAKWRRKGLPAYVQVALIWESLDRGLIPKPEDMRWQAK